MKKTNKILIHKNNKHKRQHSHGASCKKYYFLSKTSPHPPKKTHVFNLFNMFIYLLPKNNVSMINDSKKPSV